MRLAATLDDVIAILGEVVADCRARGDRLGYFPALYRRVTVAVKEGIAAGRFEDGPRMERLDVVFANRYLDALRRHRAGEPTTRSWELAFGAARSRWPIVLQHLLLGMNAHINLDLGVAAAEVAPGAALPGLRADFLAINAVLASLLAEVKAELTTIWPPLRVLDRLGGDADDAVIDFSMAHARDDAWALAEALASVPDPERVAPIADRDAWTAGFGEVVRRPPLVTRLAALWVRLGERGDVARIIDTLAR